MSRFVKNMILQPSHRVSYNNWRCFGLFHMQILHDNMFYLEVFFVLNTRDYKILKYLSNSFKETGCLISSASIFHLLQRSRWLIEEMSGDTLTLIHNPTQEFNRSCNHPGGETIKQNEIPQFDLIYNKNF